MSQISNPSRELVATSGPLDPSIEIVVCIPSFRRPQHLRLTLESLVLDGRIHPQRIEEQYERAKAEVDALCIRAGEDAPANKYLTPDAGNKLYAIQYKIDNVGTGQDLPARAAHLG